MASILRARPYFVKMSDADWHALTNAQQEATIQNFKSGKPSPAVPTSQSTSTAAAPAQEVKEPEPTGIRNWSEPIRSISAARLRSCIIYQLDVKKDQWYSTRLTRRFVRDQAERLDSDTPEDYVYDPNPLFGSNVFHGGDGENTTVTTIERPPKNEAERVTIRNKFGVSVKTIPYLAKKNCPRCKGEGYYTVSSYPNDPVYARLTEIIECNCSYE